MCELLITLWEYINRSPHAVGTNCSKTDTESVHDELRSGQRSPVERVEFILTGAVRSFHAAIIFGLFRRQYKQRDVQALAVGRRMTIQGDFEAIAREVTSASFTPLRDPDDGSLVMAGHPQRKVEHVPYA